MLGRLGLAGFFGEHVYSAARIPRGKPHPDVYLHVDEQLRLPSSACLVIEDHPVGAAAGAAAGMTVIGLMAASHIRGGHEERLQARSEGHTSELQSLIRNPYAAFRL